MCACLQELKKRNGCLTMGKDQLHSAMHVTGNATCQMVPKETAISSVHVHFTLKHCVSTNVTHLKSYDNGNILLYNCVRLWLRCEEATGMQSVI